MQLTEAALLSVALEAILYGESLPSTRRDYFR